MNDPIPPAVQEVLDLFASELATLRFGDLEPGVLKGAEADVRSVAGEVARVELELEALRASLAERQDALIAKAQRALAYARVYAEDQPALSSRIEQMSVPRVGRRTGKVEAIKLEIEDATLSDGPSKRRARARKAEPVGALLELTPMDAMDAAPTG